jgi:hypothetical protein
MPSMGDDELRRFMLQEDRIAQIENIGLQQWFVAYSEEKSHVEHATFFSGLIPNDAVARALETSNWDIHIGDGRPLIVSHYEEGEEQTCYERFGRVGGDGVEPLILFRQFNVARPERIEIVEEFRLYFNLYHDEQRNVFLRVDGVGNDEEVIRVTDNRIAIRLRELKEFAALKDMHIASFFHLSRHSPIPFSRLGIDEGAKEIQSDLTRWYFSRCYVPLLFKTPPFVSSIMGKKLIPGLSPEKLRKRIREKPAQDTVKFIVGVDEDGEQILQSCPSPNPNDLRPIFFRREVLQKYYSNPDRYAVEDGQVSCAGIWHCRIDNNHPKYVIVHLCDLGTKLPEEELPYWKTFNVAPDGTFSDVHVWRAFHAVFTDPQLSDLVFKQAFQQFQQDWETKMGWPLFKPLAEGDAHHFKTLRIPLTADQKEFDEQVLSLAKLLVDSINEKGITGTGITVAAGKKGISKLEEFLRVKGMHGYEAAIKFLRDLWDLRMGSGHRKGSKKKSEYQRAREAFGLNKMPLPDACAQILAQATEMLDALRAAFLDDKLTVEVE